MIKNLTILLAYLTFNAFNPVFSAESTGQKIKDIDFKFEGIFGTYDKNQLQRGLQVFTEVCASCHGLQHVAFRSLGDPGGPELEDRQVKAYSQLYEIFDPELDDYREAKPADYFPMSAVENAPDLSLMAKARAGFHGPYGLGINQLVNGIGGPEYIMNLLLGFNEEEKEQAGTVLYGNNVYPGGWIGMGQPLWGDDVEYMDGTEATMEQEAEDVTAFLMWAAEPKLNARKQFGFTAILFLSVLFILLYLTNKKLWAPHKGKVKS
ncbi:MAG: cytochrome c1 [Rhodobacteraceae bacterium]|nr:MAG: cytochrome c1 [Paracoccaceae bacterium]